MKITGDQFLIKKINKSIVFDHIIHHAPLSRARISELAGLNKSTVSTLVNELIEDQMVYEIGTGQSSGGRKPVLLLFNNLAGYAVGVDLGVNYILTVLTDLQGNVINETTAPLSDLKFEAVLAQLISCIRTIVQPAPLSAYGIVGIGIGVPGTVDDGVVLFAPNLGWENVNLREIIFNEFQVPVTIDNEANAGAVGEKEFGAGISAANLVYLSVGIGIGTGIIIKNELYRGASGLSGEMGHFSIEMNGPLCPCGNRGCWELYASEKALLEQAEHRLGPGGNRLGPTGSQPSLSGHRELEDLITLAKQGNSDVIELFAVIGNHLGIGITNILHVFNPELIIIGNRLTAAEEWLLDAIQSSIRNRSLTYSRREPRIQFSTLGTRSAVLGAAYFAISNFFAITKVSVE